jgi:hypothetical protein
MTPATRAKALEKLSLFAVKIGYPDKWRDYSALKIDAADLLGNVRRANAFRWNYALSKLDKPVTEVASGRPRAAIRGCGQRRAGTCRRCGVLPDCRLPITRSVSLSLCAHPWFLFPASRHDLSSAPQRTVHAR